MSHLPPDVAQAAGIRFVCPRCRGPLSFEEGDARCENCQASYPSQEGIRYFFLDSAASGVTGLANYTENFFSVETAATYAHSFETVPRKRWRTKRELAVLDRLLGGDPGQCVLNIPCGSGRLSAPLRKARRLLIEADSSPGQLALNRRRVGNDPAVVLITASAFHLPLPDAAVDTVVCARLSHHLSDAAARERLFG
ncbi:MAG: methyltransferase domain-containing protein, partial [Proteobacteria bacterium]